MKIFKPVVLDVNDKIVLKLQMEIGFEKDSAIGDIDVVKKNFKNALKESVLELLNDNDDINSFNILDVGIFEDGVDISKNRFE